MNGQTLLTIISSTVVKAKISNSGFGHSCVCLKIFGKTNIMYFVMFPVDINSQVPFMAVFYYFLQILCIEKYRLKINLSNI